MRRLSWKRLETELRKAGSQRRLESVITEGSVLEE